MIHTSSANHRRGDLLVNSSINAGLLHYVPKFLLVYAAIAVFVEFLCNAPKAVSIRMKGMVTSTALIHQKQCMYMSRNGVYQPIMAVSSSSDKLSPNSLAILRIFFNDILPVPSSSKSLHNTSSQVHNQIAARPRYQVRAAQNQCEVQ